MKIEAVFTFVEEPVDYWRIYQLITKNDKKMWFWDREKAQDEKPIYRGHLTDAFFDIKWQTVGYYDMPTHIPHIVRNDILLPDIKYDYLVFDEKEWAEALDRLKI